MTITKKIVDLYYYLSIIGFNLYSRCPIKDGFSFVFIYKYKNIEHFIVHITLKHRTYEICEYKNLLKNFDCSTFDSLVNSRRFIQSSNAREIASYVQLVLTLLRRHYIQLI